jgi:molecular chaperone DnaK
MKSELETLQQALYAAGAAVYQQAAGAEAAAGAAPGGNGVQRRCGAPPQR